MSQQIFIAFIVFIFAASFTPGPNNIMLMASGLNHGIAASLRHVAGVTIGYLLLFTSVGVGLGAVFARYPLLQTLLKYGGAAYLIYFAYRIATARPSDGRSGRDGRPQRFGEAALFQLVNVKGWVVAVSSISTYAAVAAFPWNIALLAAVVFAATLSSALSWLVMGAALQSLLRSPRAIRVFNVTMAVLLLASLYPVLAER